MSEKSDTDENPKHDHIPLIEWLVAGIGLILIGATLSFLLYKAFFVEKGDARIEFQIEKIVALENGAVVLAKAHNKGGKTVSNFQILTHADGQERETTLDYLPAKSSRAFGIFFSHVPQKNEIRFEAGGYQEP